MSFFENARSICNSLTGHDISKLKLLWRDLIPEDVRSKMTNGGELYKVLEEAKLIEARNLCFLCEGLQLISRHDIVRALKKFSKSDLNLQMARYEDKISSYRVLLHEVAEKLSLVDLQKLCKLVFKLEPPNIRVNSHEALGIMELGHVKLSPGNFVMLKDALTIIGRRDLVMTIDLYEYFQGETTGATASTSTGATASTSTGATASTSTGATASISTASATMEEESAVPKSTPEEEKKGAGGVGGSGRRKKIRDNCKQS